MIIVTKWILDLQNGKFHAEMTSTTPKGSGTIFADDGKVVIEVGTCMVGADTDISG